MPVKAREIDDIAAACRDLTARVDTMWTDLPLGAGNAVSGLQTLLGAPPDLVVFDVADGMRLVYLKTIVDRGRLEDLVVHLQAGVRPPWPLQPIPSGVPALLACASTPVRTFGAFARELLAGHVVLLSGGGAARGISLENWPARDIAEPTAEIVVQGPHDGFVEDLDTNVALLRRRIPEPELRIERLVVGSRSSLQGVLLYVRGCIRPGLLARVRRELRRARPAFVTDTSMLEQWLTRRSGVIFPTTGRTERPDVATAALLGGCAVVLAEGSPVALSMPHLFVETMHAPDDYYTRAPNATFRRALRLAGTFVALVASPLFVALITVNRELVPTPLFISIAQARAGVPLSAFLEIVVLELIVEIVREAGLHLPGALGQTVSIVGAVVVGQSAVIAGLVSAPSVVVVAVGFLCSFILPSNRTTLSLRLLRFPLIILAEGFGVLGIAWGLATLVAYLCSLDSYGVPYLSPLVPPQRHPLQDSLARRPLPALRRTFLARREPGWGDLK